jgi:hypothetical protein
MPLTVRGGIKNAAPEIYMRSNKQLLFAMCGLCGGALGALAGDVFPLFQSRGSSVILSTAAWAAWCGGGIAIGLFTANTLYSRRTVTVALIFRAMLSGVVTGAIAGAVAQFVFSLEAKPTLFSNVVIRSLCWGLMGSALGAQLSRVIPNMGLLRSGVAGFAGGTLGGFGFLLLASTLTETLGRMFGLGVLGAALGLALIVMEVLSREAEIEVRWGPKETTSFSLGPKPIYIGGGDDHIRVEGLPEHAASVVYDDGRIQYADLRTSRKTELRNGSKVKVGNLEVLVRVK